MYVCPHVFPGLDPPASVSVDVTGIDTVVVSWNPSVSRMCDVLIGNYSVRYQLSSGCSVYTSVYTSNTRVTLQDLVPYAEYNVSVAAINSNGDMSTFSALAQFTVTQTAPPPGKNLAM